MQEHVALAFFQPRVIPHISLFSNIGNIKQLEDSLFQSRTGHLTSVQYMQNKQELVNKNKCVQ